METTTTVPGRQGVRWKRIFQVIFVSLLAASHITRLLTPDHNPRPDQRSIEVSVVDSDQTGKRRVTISFADSDPAKNVTVPADNDTIGDEEQNSDERRETNPDAALPVVFLLHGSPAASGSMMGMHRALERSGKYRLITPDLPGFAASSFPIPDYSVRAHAQYMIQLMDSLHISQAHFVGYSMSGGVVIEVSRISPERVASITLLSAIGAQELELMGDYHLNHAVHGVQLAFLWLIQEGFPHFGWMADAMLNTGYARNFYDTDQRPLRDALRRLEGPVQIIHGKDDSLVPFRAAVEHQRIVPQSELHTFDSGGHGLAFSAPDTLASLIGSFVDRADLGTATLISGASPERRAQSKLPYDTSSRPPATGMSLFILCSLIVITTLVSEDLACIGAGLFAASGTISMTAALASSFGGIVTGDVLIYIAGRTLGYKAATVAPLKWIVSRDRLEHGEDWFKKHGMKLIITSRFIPGTRFATYFTAGVMQAPFRTFLLYFLVAAAIWTPLIVGASALAGAEFWGFYESYESYALAGLIVFLVTLYLAVHVLPSMFTFRGRRLLLSKWYRLTRWEYWPLSIFYVPVLWYIIWLGIRYRSLTVFTAANPSIPHGGFKGESKSSILSALASGGLVPEFAEIPEGSHAENFVSEFMSSRALNFPIVLKPVAGERGNNVLIVHDSTDLEKYFEQNNSPTLIQDFAPGREFGIFYYRFPDEESGHIFSITDKKLLTLRGDGKSTVERLILDDPQAIYMANYHLDHYAGDLERVPESGESVPLVVIGTHSRGAVFLDATGKESLAFTEAIDKAAKGFDGFYFGRFDVRISGEDPLKSGENIKIIELNGVTSEATHIYDPKYSLLHAYKTLFKQWSIAFAIGSANSKLGAPVTSIRELLSVVISRNHKE